MGMNPLAAVSVARIIGRCRCRGQGFLARGNDDLYLRQAGVGSTATWQSTAPLLARRHAPAAPRPPARRAAVRRGTNRPSDDAGSRTAVSAAAKAAGPDRGDPRARRCCRNTDLARLWGDGI